jgi:translation elongation factor EF-G
MSESSTHKRPIICVVIRPKTDDDRQSLQRALSELAQQDSTIGIETESPDGQTTISGMGELHLEVICDRIVYFSGLKPIVRFWQFEKHEKGRSEPSVSWGVSIL